MKERTALALVFAATIIATVAAYALSAWVRASEDAFLLVCLLILAVAANTSSRVVMHYRPQ